MRIIDDTQKELGDFETTCDDIETFLKEKYSNEASEESLPKNNKDKAEFRVYSELNERVSNFYRDNHKYQTLEFVLKQKKKYEALDRMEMGVWEGKLNYN